MQYNIHYFICTYSIADESSVVIEWEDLRRFSAKIVDWIYFVPVQTLQILDDVATQLLQERFTDLYRYRRVRFLNIFSIKQKKNYLY
jgi:DNA replicative helicase MCM subunit Mcm2 (Cdc46/Mcm family)